MTEEASKIEEAERQLVISSGKVALLIKFGVMNLSAGQEHVKKLHFFVE